MKSSYHYAAVQSYQVLQRDEADTARIEMENGEVLELKTGGPYTVGEKNNILVGDIWILAGQSNMEGIGDLIDVEEPSPFVHSFQSREEWAVAEEPLHWLGESPRIVHHRLWGIEEMPHEIPARDANRNKGAGLGLTFGKERYARTGVPVGLIPAAHGGTSMEQWDPQLRDLGSESLYGALYKRVEEIGGRVTGVLWYQGESNASPYGVERYPQQMDALIAALRADLHNPDLPFYYVQLGRFVTPEASDEGWSGIREAQRRLSKQAKNVAFVTAIDLELDDLIHVGTQGLKRLGRRLADAADGKLAPDVEEISFDAKHSRITVKFSNVQGGLHAAGLPAGFSLRTTEGKEVRLIYKTTLEGDTVTLHLVTDQLPEGITLWYGWGIDPYCNVVDGRDAAIPAFGPLGIGVGG